MARLSEISVGELDAALEDAGGPRAAKRLLAARIYKRGPSVPMIADWLGTREGTIYRWFDRLESEPIGEAVVDRSRPGRPAELTPAQRAEFEAAVDRPPADAGFDESAWSPALARTFLAREFGVDYSTRHVRRLLAAANRSDTSAEDSS